MSLRDPQRQRLPAAAVIGVVAALPVLGAGCGGDGAQEQAAAGTPAPSARPVAPGPLGGAARWVRVRPLRAGDGGLALRATVRHPRARIVAVSFFAGGHALGTDTTIPYKISVVPGDLARGRHRVRAVAVDRFGRRTASRFVTATVASPAAAITATPTAGLDRALAALRAGHTTVRLGPGRYALPELQLGTGARLVGAGPSTVLAPAAGSKPWALLNIQGHHVAVARLTVDGAGRAQRAVGVADGSSDVRLQRVVLRGVTVNGVEAYGAHRDVTVQDSVIAGGPGANAGVFDLGSQNSRDVSVVRTRISGFDGYGVVFAQRFYRRRSVALHNLALDLDISDIVDPTRADGRSEGGIWTGGVAAAIISNRVRRAGTDGIQTVGSSRGTTIVANDVARTPVGIYLEHSTDTSLIARNRISDVGTGINVEWRHAGGGSSANTFAGNRITRAADAGIFLDVGSDANRVEGNRFVGGARPAIVLQGASANLVLANRGCGSSGAMVREQPGRRENGAPAAARANRVVRNVGARSCTA
jgi:hypothetical protein